MCQTKTAGHTPLNLTQTAIGAALCNGKDGCSACPFSMTEESEQAYNYGCLPTHGEIMDMANRSGRPWGCHDGSGRVCQGYASVASQLGLPTKGDTMQLDSWAHRGPEATMSERFVAGGRKLRPHNQSNVPELVP